VLEPWLPPAHSSWFRALILRAPFLDVIGVLEDNSQFLSASDRLEFGDPAIPENRNLMARFSPYENLAANYFPACYLLCGSHDSRIPLSESLRWMAKLRDNDLGKSQHLLHLRHERGHELHASEEEVVACTADEVAFIVSDSNRK
jgi:oligopeptidase B